MTRTLLIPVAAALLVGCAAEADTAAFRVEHLEDGTPVYIYERLPEAAEVLETDLTIGVGEGEDAYMFGDIRSVDADGAGNIYVLDAQAMEVRTFDPSGVFLRTVAARGQGPGEITRANGMQVAGDTAVWIQDHGKYLMTAVALDGSGELGTAPMPVRRYGYAWSGGLDERGSLWKTSSRNLDADAPMMPTQSGPISSEMMNQLVRRDLATGTQDTLELATQRGQTYAMIRSNGYAMYGVPFSPGWSVAVAPNGDIWHVQTSAYRLARLSPTADTLLIIQVNRSGEPVTEQDRQEVRDRMAEAGDEQAIVGAELAALMPEQKPVLFGLRVDDSGRVWVRVGSDPEAPARFDIFEPDGTFVRSVELEAETLPYLHPAFRENRVYGISTDSLGAPVVFRTRAMGG